MGHTGLVHHACAIAASLVLTSPAAGQAQTDADRLFFPGASAASLVGPIAAACLDRDWQIDDVEPSTVRCMRPGVPDNLVMYGPRQTRWSVVVEFIILDMPDGALVHSRDYVRSESVLGVERRHPESPTDGGGAGIALLKAIASQ